MHDAFGGYVRKGMQLALVFGLSGALACQEVPTSPQLDIKPYLTPEVRAQLNEKGQFILPEVETSSSMITADRARALATAFCHQAGGFYRQGLEARFGGPIDFSNLQANDRVYFADTPYGAVPPDAHVAFRKLYGPYYLVTMKTLNGDPVLSIAVSAYNTDLVLENGRVKFPRNRGNDFFMLAMNRNGDLTFPLAPENALGQVITKLRARVKGVNLILRDARMSPQMAVWRIDLEDVTPVNVAQRKISTHEIFVDPRGDLYVATTNEPHEVQMEYLSASDPRQTKQGVVPIRPTFVLHFDAISN